MEKIMSQILEELKEIKTLLATPPPSPKSEFQIKEQARKRAEELAHRFK